MMETGSAEMAPDVFHPPGSVMDQWSVLMAVMNPAHVQRSNVIRDSSSVQSLGNVSLKVGSVMVRWTVTRLMSRLDFYIEFIKPKITPISQTACKEL